ncbi:MAG: hypothetical protein IPM39_10550 [Chloroflexi bacterium]|nr:hypothetical protein [Chloroflexota bacterium]
MKAVNGSPDYRQAAALQRRHKFIGKRCLPRRVHTVNGHAQRMRPFDLRDALGDCFQHL